MKYNEYLESLNLESLKVLADMHGIDYIASWSENKDEAASIREEILTLLKDVTYLEQVIFQLEENEKNLLKIVFFSDEAVDQDSVIRKFNNSYGKESNVRVLIDNLWRYGFFIKFEMYYRNRPYIGIVDECRNIVGRLIAQELLGEWGGTELQTFVGSDPFELSQDIYSFLSFVNNNEVKLTSKNVIFRKSAQKIEEHFVANSTYMDNLESEYSERFAFINKLVYMVDMVSYNKGIVELNHEKVNKWLKITLMDKIKAASNFMETFYLGSKREITEAINKVKTVLLMSYDRPLNMNNFEEIIKKYHADMNFNYLQSNFKRILDHMVLIGMVEYLLDDDKNFYFRLNKYGWAFYKNKFQKINEQEENGFYIQPNFEIISTINLNPVIRWQLDSFCEIGKIEKTIHYWITKASIHRALSNDISVDVIIDFLKKYTKSGMPQNIEYSIKEWASSYGNVYLMDVVILRCKTESLANEITSIPQLSQSILGEITEKDIIINRQDVDDVTDILVKKGYMAKHQVVEAEGSTTGDQEADDHNLENKIGLSKVVYEDIDVKQFDIDMRYLDTSGHYKNTVMDIKPPQKGEKTGSAASKVYSPTTFQAKEILEKAIEQKKPVLIDYYSQENDTSSRIRIEPKSIKKEDSLWTVHGYSQQKEQKIVLDINNIQSIEFSNLN